MKIYKPKLIIWDFDGVIADTERLFLRNRLIALNEVFHPHWDFDTLKKHIQGQSNTTAEENLAKAGFQITDEYRQLINDLDQNIFAEGFGLTFGIKDIFERISANQDIKQCIATGGFKESTLEKIKITEIGKYFNEKNIFTAEMVDRGKPAPDIFLLAAKSMKVLPSDCLVVEDSPSGLLGAKKAGMLTAAFCGYESHPEQFEKRIKDLEIDFIFKEMKDFMVLLNNWFYHKK